MGSATLLIEAKDGARYRHEGVSNVRLARRELRWTNARSEKRQMALAFVGEWRLI